MGIDVRHMRDEDEGEDMFLAYVGDAFVGCVRLCEPFQENRRAVVHASVTIKRMGVATALYDAAEAFLAERGQVLVPSAALSIEATKFWASRDLARLQQVHPGRDASYDGPKLDMDWWTGTPTEAAAPSP